MKREHIRRGLNQLLNRFLTLSEQEDPSPELADRTAKWIELHSREMSHDEQVQLMQGLLEIQEKNETGT